MKKKALPWPRYPQQLSTCLCSVLQQKPSGSCSCPLRLLPLWPFSLTSPFTSSAALKLVQVSSERHSPKASAQVSVLTWLAPISIVCQLSSYAPDTAPGSQDNTVSELPPASPQGLAHHPKLLILGCPRAQSLVSSLTHFVSNLSHPVSKVKDPKRPRFLPWNPDSNTHPA